MLWAVVVETTDSSGEHERYRALILAHTEKGAKVAAGKAVDRLVGRERRFVEAEVVNPYKTGLVSLIEEGQELKMVKHDARPIVTGYRSIPGIANPVAVWTETCLDCGRPVRRAYHVRNGSRVPTFWHAAGKAKPGDPRRQPHSPAHRQAISDGMRAANSRRAARR